MVDEKLDQDLLLCIARARANGSTGAELGVVDERAATEIEQLATPASQRDGNADDREEAGEFNVLKVVELRLRQQEQTASVNNREHPKAAVAPPDSLPVTASSPKGNLLHSLEQNNSNTVNQAQEAVTPTNPPTRQLDISKRYMLHPGAYAQDGPGVDSNADVNEEHTTAEATMNAPDTNNGLAVANIVEDGDLPTALPHNAGSDDSAAENRKKEHTNQIKSNVLFGVILLVICILILVSVLVSIKRKELDVAPTAAPTGNPSSSPTHAPTSLVDSVVSLFPAETIIKVFDDPSSPQSKAFDWLLEDTLNLPDLTVERIKQKFILATLFFATEGTNWAANDDWLSYDIHECSWFNKPDFAQYSTMGSLYPGYLKEFFVSSEPTPSICDNNGLYRHLWLDANNLGGTLPEELFLLTTLRTLSLGYNQVEGSIPSQVGQLVELEGLFLNSMKSVGTTIPTEIGLLTKLKAIGLHDNHHSGSIPSELWELSALDTLLALRNPMLKGSIPTEIGGMTKMRFMDLNDCDLTGSIPSEIGRVSLLEWVVGYGNRLTGTLPSELLELSNLMLFSFWDNSIRGTIPSRLGHLQNLFLLSLRDNELSGPIPNSLGLLTGLSVTLNLRGNLLTGSLPSELGCLSSLTELECSNNQLTGSIPSEFGRLLSAGRLTLANNSLSGTLPPELSALQEVLHTLYLEGNPELSGTIPASVCSMNGTCIGSVLDNCVGPYGLSFDCSEFFCGCGCPCLAG